jgi:sulfur-carrier protein adenylyltransferase/sulfurtransferase
VLIGTPNVYGSIFRFEGQASVFALPDGRGPSIAVSFPSLRPWTCAELRRRRILGVLPGLVGTIQATEPIKLIVGAREPLVGGCC